MNNADFDIGKPQKLRTALVSYSRKNRPSWTRCFMTSGIKIVKNMNRKRESSIALRGGCGPGAGKLFESEWDELLIIFDEAREDFVVRTVRQSPPSKKTRRR